MTICIVIERKSANGAVKICLKFHGDVVKFLKIILL